jgi:uncharacterized protein YjbI with pentapeptide repeats
MTKTSAKTLRERWSVGQLEDLRAQFEVGCLEASPFGTTADGYADFRGVTLNENIRPLGLDINQVDFSHSRLRAFIVAESTLSDCLFDRSQLEWGDFRSEFRKLSFEKAKLRGSAWGAERSRYNGCTFTGANLSRSIGLQAFFAACDFSGANWNNSLLGNCRFEGSIFSGTLKGILLNSSGSGGGFVGCDFRNASFRDCAFRYATFEDCTFPVTCVVLRDWPARLGLLEQPLEAVMQRYPETSLRTWIKIWRETASEFPDLLCDLADLQQSLGVDCGRAVFDLMKEIQAEHGS